MSTTFKPVNYTEHGHLKIQEIRNFPHVANEQIIPLVVHEFSAIASQMPIVFVKNKDTGEFQPVAILGFQQGENVFQRDDGWQSVYVPAVITHHPFALMPVQDQENQYQLMMIEPNNVTNETRGEALFDENGVETPYLVKRKEALGRYYENTLITQEFCRTLQQFELFTPQSLTLNYNGQQMKIDGLFLVDEQKLNQLPDDNFIALRKRGYIASIYAHLGSVHQLYNVARLKAKNG
jgi:hypothetical protein